MRLLSTCRSAVVASLAAVPAARADVQLTMQNGRVSLVAKDATVRQILTEWARVGQTQIVNVRARRRRAGHARADRRAGARGARRRCCARSAATWPRRARCRSPTRRTSTASSSCRRARRRAGRRRARRRPSIRSAVSPFIAQQRRAEDDAQRTGRRAAPRRAALQPGRHVQPVPAAAGRESAGRRAARAGPAACCRRAAPPAARPRTAPTPSSPFGGVSVPGMIAPAPQPPAQPPQGQARRPGGPGGSSR